MLKTKYFEMKQLIASLEEISEDTTGEFDSLDDQELQDAQIALEGYQDLLLVNQKLTKQGIKIDESVATGLLSLASPKINKDPLLKNYSEESVADKAKDFGKWIVEKIKALFNWFRDKIKSMGQKASELYLSAKKSKLMEKIRKVNRDEKYNLSTTNYIKLISYTIPEVKPQMYYSFEYIKDIIKEIGVAISNVNASAVHYKLDAPFEMLSANWNRRVNKTELTAFNSFPLFLHKYEEMGLHNRTKLNVMDEPLAPLKFTSLNTALSTIAAEDASDEHLIEGKLLGIMMNDTLDFSEFLSKEYLDITKDCDKALSKIESTLNPDDSELLKKSLSITTQILTDYQNILRNILMSTSTMIDACDDVASSIVGTQDE